MAYKSQNKLSTIGEAVEFALADLGCLRDEMSEWRDNMGDSEGLSQTEKYQEVEATADALENINEDDYNNPPMSKSVIEYEEWSNKDLSLIHI